MTEFNLAKIIEFINTNLDTVIWIMFILWFFITEIVIRKKLKKVKNDISKKYMTMWKDEIDHVENLDQDLYIEYYKWKNILNLLRFVIIFTWWAFLILFRAPSIFNFLAIAVWAIIITFKEVILSFIWFFYVSTQYKIWENIVIWDEKNIIRWEIIYLNILNVWIIWKSDNGEHNWQFYIVPNFKLIVDNVRKEELSINKYRKEEIEIYFKNDLFQVSFDEFLMQLKEYLDKELTRKYLNNIWNYKTYIGYKYKMRYKYDKDYLIIKIFIIEKHRNILKIQWKIVSFVERLKVDKTKNEE